MRATRAYLAGFGTSGSLLAGAAALFLFGSAIIAFKGLPQIGGGSASSNVAAAPTPAAFPVVRRLSTVVAGTHPHGVRVHFARASVRPVKSRASTGARTIVGGPVGGGSPGSMGAPPAAGSAAGASGSSSTGAVGSGCGTCSRSSDPVTSLSGTVTRTATTAGTDVGTQVQNLSGSAGGQVGNVSPQLGNTVTTSGSTVANTVTSATNSLTSVVGSATGGGH